MNEAPHTLPALSDAQLEQIVTILGAVRSDEEHEQSPHEAETAALLGDAMLSRRAIDWIPEAFAIALLGHMKVTPPKEFSARSSSGQWHKFPMKTDPIFVQAIRYALRDFHEGDRERFGIVAMRSSLLAAANQALHAGHSIEGASLSGLALIGIPAEVYDPTLGPLPATPDPAETLPPPAATKPAATKPWWRRILG